MTTKSKDKIIEDKNDGIDNKGNYNEKVIEPDDVVWELALKTVESMKEILQNLLRDSIYQAFSSEESKNKTDPEIIILINDFYKNHLNSMWHSYGNKSNQKAIDDIDSILSIGFIKGAICLMSWLAGIGTMIIKSFDIDMMVRATNLNTTPFVMFVDSTIRLHIYTMIVKDIEDYVTRGCTNECTNDRNVCGYDGNDIIDEHGKYKPFVRSIADKK